VISQGRIRQLPPAVADAIAAGEVVERPASVVKELCENALDAGATRIDVVIEGGGTVRIRVTDDGRGIDVEDLPLAVARHATSKIGGTADLVSVRTLGFRGEALASIAAVADLVLVSRPRGAPAGGRIRVRAAELVESGVEAAAPGTSVEVRDLFAATPARLRFLRGLRSEAAAAVRVVSDLALTHPDVAYTCTSDGRTALRAPGGALDDALAAVFGRSAAAELVALEGDGTVAVSGAISQPRAHRGSRDGLIVVVNGRRVHNRSLVVAVEDAYRGLIPSGRHPYGVVMVDIDPELVDVNVHPAKREVRFRDDRAVFSAVQRACWAAVAGGHTYTAAPPLEAVFAAGGHAEVRGTLVLHDYPPATTAPALAPDQQYGDAPVAAGDGGITQQGVSLEALGPLRALGQAGAQWLVAESPRGVVLVDPHAAHEKVLYAELMAAWEERGSIAVGRSAAAGSQLLLMPAVIECDAPRLARLEGNAELLAHSGFSVEPFGPGLLRCTAIPAASAGVDVSRLVLEVLDTLGADQLPPTQRRHRLAAVVACHSAVRFGDPLEPAEQQRLLDRLQRTPGAMTCPHGRPTVILLDDPTLRRAFRRPSG
jgi:DNA mismatch repair protein MutL